MGVKMNRFLQAKREQARSENRLFDWAWIKICWLPVKSYRIITKGKRKGWIEVELFNPPRRKRIIPAKHLKNKDRTIVQ